MTKGVCTRFWHEKGHKETDSSDSNTADTFRSKHNRGEDKKEGQKKVKRTVSLWLKSYVLNDRWDTTMEWQWRRDNRETRVTLDTALDEALSEALPSRMKIKGTRKCMPLLPPLIAWKSVFVMNTHMASFSDKNHQEIRIEQGRGRQAWWKGGERRVQNMRRTTTTEHEEDLFSNFL